MFIPEVHQVSALVIVVYFSAQVSCYRMELMEVAEGHKSILKSALLREVKKLSQLGL